MVGSDMPIRRRLFDNVPVSIFIPQESIIAGMKNLDMLISWVQKRKGGREVVKQAIEALQELFVTVLLPDRKLKFLEQQPLQVGCSQCMTDGKGVMNVWCRFCLCDVDLCNVMLMFCGT